MTSLSAEERRAACLCPQHLPQGCAVHILLRVRGDGGTGCRTGIWATETAAPSARRRCRTIQRPAQRQEAAAGVGQDAVTGLDLQLCDSILIPLDTNAGCFDGLCLAVFYCWPARQEAFGPVDIFQPVCRRADGHHVQADFREQVGRQRDAAHCSAAFIQGVMPPILATSGIRKPAASVAIRR